MLARAPAATNFRVTELRPATSSCAVQSTEISSKFQPVYPVTQRLFLYLPGMLMLPRSMQSVVEDFKKSFFNDQHLILNIGMLAPRGPDKAIAAINEAIQLSMDAAPVDQIVLVGESWGADLAIIVSEQLTENSIAIAAEPDSYGFYQLDQEWRDRMDEDYPRWRAAYKDMGPYGERAMQSHYGWLGSKPEWRRLNNLHDVKKRVLILSGIGGDQPGMETVLKLKDVEALRPNRNITFFNVVGGGHRVLKRHSSVIAGITTAFLNPAGNF